MKTKAFVIALAVAFLLPIWSSGQENQMGSSRDNVGESVFQQNDSVQIGCEQLAHQIIAGTISEELFLALNLTPKQALKVFHCISVKRGWKFTDEQLKSIVERNLQGTAAEDQNGIGRSAVTCHYGGCAQDILEAQPRSGAVKAYPYAITSPINGECGSDSDDSVLLYNTPQGGSGNPNSIRYWHDNWYVRWVLRTWPCYTCGLGANGLCSSTTRVCMGSCPFYAGLGWSDIAGVYLWI